MVTVRAGRAQEPAPDFTARLAAGGRERPRYTALPVRSTVEALEGNKVKLSVEVEEA
ncbi:MAG: hypothetical protein QOJ09_2286, partial [Actinomycetota bacterium]|nr:hypothetical protein [Actinomycetota bacterium]